jgi:hypothetical protein
MLAFSKINKGKQTEGGLVSSGQHCGVLDVMHRVFA